MRFPNRTELIPTKFWLTLFAKYAILNSLILILSGLDESTSFYTVISLITSITDILLEVCQLIKENRNAEIQNFYYNNDNLFSISNWFSNRHYNDLIGGVL